MRWEKNTIQQQIDHSVIQQIILKFFLEENCVQLCIHYLNCLLLTPTCSTKFWISLNMIMYQSAWLNLEPDFINHHSMQIAIHLSAHFNLIDSDNYQQGHDFFLLQSRSYAIWRKTMLGEVEVSHSRLRVINIKICF